jgi:hypothetical protein
MVAVRRPSWKLISFVGVTSVRVSVYVLSVADRYVEDIFIGLCTLLSYSGSWRRVVWLMYSDWLWLDWVCSSCSVSVCWQWVSPVVGFKGHVQMSGTGCSAHVPFVSWIRHGTAERGLPSTHWWSVWSVLICSAWKIVSAVCLGSDPADTVQCNFCLILWADVAVFCVCQNTRNLQWFIGRRRIRSHDRL